MISKPGCAIALTLVCLLNCPPSLAQNRKALAPGAPGADAHWPSASKVGFGTSTTAASKVWYTLNAGAMTEVFYPRLDVPNTQSLQLILCKANKCLSETDDMTHEVQVVNQTALSFRQINRTPDGAHTITKTYATDPLRPTVLIDVKISGELEDVSAVYVYYDPSLNNSGMHDTAFSRSGALLAFDGKVASALVANDLFMETTSGFLGTSDGLSQLKQAGRLTTRYGRASRGNVVQVARIRRPASFTLALGFGATPRRALRNSQLSLKQGFTQIKNKYEAGWQRYLRPLRKISEKYQSQFNMAAMVLKALEDKTYPGAMIASPSVPWGGGPNANNPTISGYHAVWSRDLYQVATAFLALGDRHSAVRTLDYLFRVQQRPDGSFPQNSWVDGRPIGGGIQLDQIAFPLVLAYQLDRTDRHTWRRHIKPAAQYLVRNGPVTNQERWEEESGFSPSTIAAEIAGLVCAAHIAEINGEKAAAAVFLRTADLWAKQVDSWCATSNGPYENGQYYLRITEKGDPSNPAKIEINSGGGTYDQREIVDGGFLELVRLGIKSPGDPLILGSVKVVDKLIKVTTPAGPAWYRYTHDGYGERPDGMAYDGRTGVGRLWTLLTGERGQFELARGDLDEARRLLETLSGFANEGLMIPEQVWDRKVSESARVGTGTGSATPLAWSMAQFIRLAVNIEAGRNLDTPEIVSARYLLATASDAAKQRIDIGLENGSISHKINRKSSFMWSRRANMSQSRLSSFLGLGILACVVLACKFNATTANISSLKLGKDRTVSEQSSEFAPQDTVYGVATVSNVPDKVQVKGRLLIEEVEGQKTGPIPGLEDTVDLPGDGTATFTFTPPSAGWPKGKYKMEILLLTESGEQKDQEVAAFSVS